MSYHYDSENIFAKILRGEIPCDKVVETEHTLAFRDIRPLAPEHVLVIPKGAYVTFDHFADAASEAEIVDFTRTVGRIATDLSVAPTFGAGYRIMSNAGADANQEVPHMHVHLVAGRPLGRLLDTVGAG